MSKLFISYMYVYVYIYVCVCVCVCVWEWVIKITFYDYNIVTLNKHMFVFKKTRLFLHFFLIINHYLKTFLKMNLKIFK